MCPAGLRLCREGPFTATGVCLCCCVRPFRRRTVAGFFSGLALNEGLTVFWPDRPNSPPFLCALPIPPCSFLFPFFHLPGLPKKKKTREGCCSVHLGITAAELMSRLVPFGAFFVVETAAQTNKGNTDGYLSLWYVNCTTCLRLVSPPLTHPP